MITVNHNGATGTYLVMMVVFYPAFKIGKDKLTTLIQVPLQKLLILTLQLIT